MQAVGTSVVKRWILLHLFPDMAGYLRMVAQYAICAALDSARSEP